MIFKFVFGLLFLFSFSFESSAQDTLTAEGEKRVKGALSPEMKQFIVWESSYNTFYNGMPRAGPRLAPFAPQYIEFQWDHPSLYALNDYTDWLIDKKGLGPHAFVLDESEKLNPSLRKYFFVEREGKKYFRFYVSPEDSKYGLQVAKYLEDLKVPFSMGTSSLVGYRTVSRSLIFFDPESGLSFSYKPSTDKTASDPGDRVLPLRWAHLNRRLSEYFSSLEPQMQNLKVAREDMAGGFPHLDVAFQVRPMTEVSEGHVAQASGFVAYNKSEAKRIAALSGKSYKEFWREAFYIKGRAIAEMAALLGYHYTSTHSQNMRWELNSDGTLTGKMVLLDLSDGRPIENIFKKRGQEKLLNEWRKLANNTNPIEKDGLGFSAFVTPDNESFRESMYKGVEDRLKEILPLEPLDYSVIHYMLVGTRSGESGVFRSIPDLEERLDRQFKRMGWQNFSPACGARIENMKL